MPPFFNDTFTEAAADTELSLHAPDTGTGWARLYSDGGNPRYSVIALTDRCKCSTGANDSGVVYTANATYPGADYEVQVTWTGASNFATRPQYLIARLADIENMYALRLASVASGCQLYKKVGGTWSALGTAVTIAVGSVVKLSVNGTAIKVHDDGVEVISVTDSALSAAGKAGLAIGGGAELVTSTDDANGASEWDGFSITDLGGGGQTITANQAAELDTAQAISKIKQRAIGQNIETESAQAIWAMKIKAIGQATETNTALPHTQYKAKIIGQVVEIESAQALAKSKTRLILQVTEMDQAQPVTNLTGTLINMVEETDIAQALWPMKRVAIVQAIEIESVQALAPRKIKIVGQVEEMGQAQPITAAGPIVVVLGLVVETNIAQPMAGPVEGTIVELHLCPRGTQFAVPSRGFGFSLMDRDTGLTLYFRNTDLHIEAL